ncbi:hypothetical protein BJ508DRAFT_161957 [Ascobolus immersus RN42]|uniref:P-loop containing nucleoside triphosphate hydrolase protein n=1 Tax=Ascobolus immersus RN42 TaxID=1160509 RepID=A0A3N4I122_ASCIM|nr:hypothetical protein BJ508DRAFT_161957 [Ascobolus immersus RN42]
MSRENPIIIQDSDDEDLAIRPPPRKVRKHSKSSTIRSLHSSTFNGQSTSLVQVKKEPSEASEIDWTLSRRSLVVASSKPHLQTASRKRSRDSDEALEAGLSRTLPPPASSSLALVKFQPAAIAEQENLPASSGAAKQRENGGTMKELLDLIEASVKLVPDDDEIVGGMGSAVDEDEDDVVDPVVERRRQLEEAVANLDLKVEQERHNTTRGTGSTQEVVEIRNRYTIKGMVVPLLSHQIVGVNWMVNEREKSGKAPRGGLLFDTMGLGKTIQCIATMCANPPPQHYGEDDPRITLIVCPPALLLQWRQEIEKHTVKGTFQVTIHHGPGKIKTARDMKKRQVVITSYDIVRNNYPKIEIPEDKEDSADREAYIAREFRRRKGVLFKVKYWRIIYDECHIIKNREADVTKAAMQLAESAEHCWCLSGTPVQNKLADLSSAFSIIKMPELDNPDRFDRILDSSSNPSQMIQLALRAAMLRRTKDDIVLDEPLAILPPKNVHEILIRFDPDSRALYDEMEDLARDEINDLSKLGKLGRSFNQIFVLLIRLRQLCNHPYLTGNDIKNWNRAKLERCIASCDTRYRRKFGEKALQDATRHSTYPIGGPLELEDSPEYQTERSSALVKVPSATHRSQAFQNRPVREFLVRLHANAVNLEDQEHHDEEEELEEVEKKHKTSTRRLQTCPYCLDELNQPVITLCGHVYCHECILEGITLEGAARRGFACMVCSEPVRESHLEVTVAEELELEDSMEDMDYVDIKEAQSKCDAKMAASFKDDINTRLFHTKKLKAMKRQLREWRNTRPGQKVVLFAHFTKFLDIIEKVTDAEGWGTVRYRGKMSPLAREKALDKFKNDPDCWIMLTSTRAGGVGLNLAHANLVISMDLWWNSANEMQAFDRVHRFGQDKEVEVVRFIVEKSVETRILERQKQKLEIAGMALGEVGFKKVDKLTQKELLGLLGCFGTVNVDPKGNITVSKD